MSATSPLETLITVIDSATNLNIGLLSSNGMWLLGGLSVIALSWAGIKVMLEGDSGPSAIANLVRIIILAGFASAIIGAGSSAGGMGRQFINGFDGLTQTVGAAAGAQGLGGRNSTGTMVTQVLSKMMAASTRMFSGDENEEPRGWFATIKEIITDPATLLIALPVLLFKVFMAVLLLVTALAYCGQLVVTQVMINIALLMMPIMVPWMLLEATSFVFDGWLRFAITACLAKVVGAIIFGLSISAVDSAATLAASADATGDVGSIFIAYAGSFLIVGIMAFLMMQAVPIANGLLSGSARGMWNPVGKMQPGAATRGAGAAMGKAGGAASTAAGKAGGAVLAGGVGAVKGAAGSKGVLQGLANAAKGGVSGAKAGAQLGMRGTLGGMAGGVASGKGMSQGVSKAAAAVQSTGSAGPLRQAFRAAKK